MNVLEIDSNWHPAVRKVFKAFLDAIQQMDAAGARRQLMDLITLIRNPAAILDDKSTGDGKKGNGNEFLQRDARIALETIKSVDPVHPVKTLIDSKSWKGDLGRVKKNIKQHLGTRDYHRVAQVVPLLTFQVEHNEDDSIREQCAEILVLIAKKHPVILETYQTVFFRLVFDRNNHVAGCIAEVLYNIDFHTFPSMDPKNIRKILTERFEENLVNAYTDRDYSRHFLKYAVTIENFTPQWIWDVELRVKTDPGFEVVKVVPEVPVSRDSHGKAQLIDLNVVKHHASKKITLFIEPRYRPSIQIECILYYKNAKGLVSRRELPVEEIDLFQLIPRFSPEPGLKFAQCKDYFDYKAKFKDNRAFFTGDLDPDNLEEKIASAILGINLTRVHEFDATVFKETYFSGLTSGTGQRIVMVNRVSREDSMINIMVAASNPAYIAGIYNKILIPVKDLLVSGRLIELKCPSCLEPLERDVDFCPWCGHRFTT